MNSLGSFLLRCWQVILSWFGFGGSDMGVGVKIVLGVVSGGVSGLNFVVAGNYEQKFINPDLSTASEPVTVSTQSDSTVPFEYHYKG